MRGDYGGYKDESGVHHLNVLDFQRDIRCPKPVVAMVAGYALEVDMFYTCYAT